MSPALPSREIQLYVVHVWRQRTRFRASVRRVDREDAQLFTTPTQLARYLAAACCARLADEGAIHRFLEAQDEGDTP